MVATAVREQGSRNGGLDVVRQGGLENVRHFVPSDGHMAHLERVRPLIGEPALWGKARCCGE